MEVKINKDVLEFNENIFFGLSLRQSVFTILGCVNACCIFFLFKGVVGGEIASWLCVLGTVPFIIFGFFKYQGLNFERLIILVVQSIALSGRRLNVRQTMCIRRSMQKKYDKKSRKHFKKTRKV